MIVLISDDEPCVRTLVEKVMRGNGHETLMAQDGMEAVRLARLHPIDAVITDMILPKLAGSALVDALHAEKPDLPVILMSGYPKETCFPCGTLPNATSFVAKPFRVDRLLGSVSAAANPA